MLKILANLGLVALMAFAGAAANAQAFPSKPIRVVVGFPPGGTTDVVLRILTERMRSELGQAVIIENKPGAGGAIATEFVKGAPADGYTLLFGGSSITMRPAIAKVNYDINKDFAPISEAVQLATFIVVRNEMPVRTVAELVSYLKANPGKLSYASVGTGSVTHFQTEQFKAVTQTDMVHVPYKGTAPALTDMLAGQLQVIVDSYATSGPFLQSGQLRALAVLLPRRSSVQPNIPTLEEAGVKGVDAVPWSGLMAPAGTPKAVIDQLNAALVTSLRDPAVQAKIRNVGGEPSGSTPDELGNRLRRETAKWGELARTIGIKPE